MVDLQAVLLRAARDHAPLVSLLDCGAKPGRDGASKMGDRSDVVFVCPHQGQGAVRQKGPCRIHRNGADPGYLTDLAVGKLSPDQRPQIHPYVHPGRGAVARSPGG